MLNSMEKWSMLVTLNKLRLLLFHQSLVSFILFWLYVVWAQVDNYDEILGKDEDKVFSCFILIYDIERDGRSKRRKCKLVVLFFIYFYFLL